MNWANFIFRIPLKFLTTGPTSNWKALAIAVLFRPGDSQISRRLILPGFERPAMSERPRLTHGPLGEEAERCKRRRAGAALVWNNRETEMGDLAEIEALFFALIGGSPGAEVVFLNQNLAVRSATILRDFHAYFLSTLAHCLLDLVQEARDRLRPVKFHDDVLNGVGTCTDPARGSGAAASVQHMLDRVSRIL